MKIFIVNFEQIIKNYTPYQNSTKEIELEKINFTEIGSESDTTIT
jgi:hypothetical protein